MELTCSRCQRNVNTLIRMECVYGYHEKKKRKNINFITASTIEGILQKKMN